MNAFSRTVVVSALLTSLSPMVAAADDFPATHDTERDPSRPLPPGEAAASAGVAKATKSSAASKRDAIRAIRGGTSVWNKTASRPAPFHPRSRVREPGLVRLGREAYHVWNSRSISFPTPPCANCAA